MDYRTSKLNQQRKIGMDFEEKGSPDDLMKIAAELKEQSKVIRGKMVRDTKPHYNNYVRSMLKDLNIWMKGIEDVIDILTYEYYKQKTHEEVKETALKALKKSIKSDSCNKSIFEALLCKKDCKPCIIKD